MPSRRSRRTWPAARSRCMPMRPMPSITSCRRRSSTRAWAAAEIFLLPLRGAATAWPRPRNARWRKPPRMPSWRTGSGSWNSAAAGGRCRCGWRERYPAREIVAVSNSHAQRALHRGGGARRGLGNLRVITADMNEFDAGRPLRPRGLGGDVGAHVQLAGAAGARARLAATGRARCSCTSSATRRCPIGSITPTRRTGSPSISSPAASCRAMA